MNHFILTCFDLKTVKKIVPFAGCSGLIHVCVNQKKLTLFTLHISIRHSVLKWSLKLLGSLRISYIYSL